MEQRKTYAAILDVCNQRLARYVLKHPFLALQFASMSLCCTGIHEPSCPTLNNFCTCAKPAMQEPNEDPSETTAYLHSESSYMVCMVFKSPDLPLLVTLDLGRFICFKMDLVNGDEVSIIFFGLSLMTYVEE